MSAGILGRNLAVHDHRGAIVAAKALLVDGDTAPTVVGHCALPGIPSGAARLVALRIGNGANIGPATALMDAFATSDAEGSQAIFDSVRASELLTSLTELAKLTLAALCPAAFDSSRDAGERTDAAMSTLGLALSAATMQIPIEPARAVTFCGDLAAHLVLDPRARRLTLHDPKVTVAAHVAGSLSAYVRASLGVSREEQTRVWREVTLAAQGHPARSR